jgi:hypothetical protein
LSQDSDNRPRPTEHSPADGYQAPSLQATSLANLAEAQRAAGLNASAEETSAEALRTLAEFNDPKAQAMKARLTGAG